MMQDNETNAQNKPNFTTSEISFSKHTNNKVMSTTASISVQKVCSELMKQKALFFPLITMNTTWFFKIAITTAFLGKIGKLQLAAGTLGLTFANVTGFSILIGLCMAMEPICGQAHGAQNKILLYKTLFMTTILLLTTTIPITLLWAYMDRILIILGQQEDITTLAKRYAMFLIPDLIVTSFLAPLKAFLSSQGKTLPIMCCSFVALALHVPYNILLSKAKGIEGVALASGLTDATMTILLALYVAVTCSFGNIKEVCGNQKLHEWARLLKLATQCCFIGCLEWWNYEILIFLAGRMRNAAQMVSVFTIVLNFDYFLNGIMTSLATCASTRVSNELGAGNPAPARLAAYVSLCIGVVTGVTGGLVMVGLRGQWGRLFSHDEGVIEGVRKMLLFMAMVEVFTFPVGVSGGIFRGTSKPWLGMTSVLGFYLAGIPLAIILSFRAGFEVRGLILGFLAGSGSSAVMLMLLVLRIDWDAEAEKAKKYLAGTKRNEGNMTEEVTDIECSKHSLVFMTESQVEPYKSESEVLRVQPVESLKPC